MKAKFLAFVELALLVALWFFLTFFVGVDILTMTCKKIRDQGFKFKGSLPSTLVVEKTNVEKENVGSCQSRAPGVLG